MQHKTRNKEYENAVISRGYTTDFESNTFLAFLKVMLTVAKVKCMIAELHALASLIAEKSWLSIHPRI